MMNSLGPVIDDNELEQMSKELNFLPTQLLLAKPRRSLSFAEQLEDTPMGIEGIPSNISVDNERKSKFVTKFKKKGEDAKDGEDSDDEKTPMKKNRSAWKGKDKVELGGKGGSASGGKWGLSSADSGNGLFVEDMKAQQEQKMKEQDALLDMLGASVARQKEIGKQNNNSFLVCDLTVHSQKQP